MTVPAYSGRLQAERRTPINPNTTAPALASLDELIGVLARAMAGTQRRRTDR